MRIPERAKPPEGGVRAEQSARLIGLRRETVAAMVMRKAPAPGAEVAAVVGESRRTHPPARSRTEGVAERMLVNAPGVTRL